MDETLLSEVQLSNDESTQGQHSKYAYCPYSLGQGVWHETVHTLINLIN